MAHPEESKVFTVVTSKTLHALRVEDGSVVAGGECLLENKASVEALLGAVSPDWKTQVARAHAGVWPDGSGWHVSTDTEAMLDRGPDALRAIAQGLQGGPSGDLAYAVCSAVDGTAVTEDGLDKWLLACAPAEGLAGVSNTLDELKILSEGAAPAGICAVDAVQRILAKAGSGTVVLWDMGSKQSSLVAVSARGAEGAVACELGLGKIFEAVQSTLRLKFKAAGERLFFNESYDFAEPGPKIAASMADALKAALGKLPPLPEPPALAFIGLTGKQSWFLRDMAAACGLKAWEPDLAEAAGALGLKFSDKAPASQFSTASMAVLGAASTVTSGSRAWSPDWVPVEGVAPAQPEPVPEPEPEPEPEPAPKPQPPPAIEKPVRAAQPPVRMKPMLSLEPSAPAAQPAPPAAAPKPAIKPPVVRPPSAAPKVTFPAPGAPAVPLPPAAAPKRAFPEPAAQAPSFAAPPPPASAPVPEPFPAAVPAIPAAPAPLAPAARVAPPAPSLPAAAAAPFPSVVPPPAPAPDPAAQPSASRAPFPSSPEAASPPIAPAKPPGTVSAGPIKFAPPGAAPAAPVTALPFEAVRGKTAPAAAQPPQRPEPPRSRMVFYVVAGVATLVALAAILVVLDARKEKADAEYQRQEEALQHHLIEQRLKESEESRKAERQRAEKEMEAAIEITRKQAEEETRRKVLAQVEAERVAKMPGTLIVATEPERASVSIDGAIPMTAPLHLDGVPPGPHHVRISMPEFEDMDIPFEIKGAKPTDLGTVTLVSAVGDLEVSSIPDGLNFEIRPANDLISAPVRTGTTPTTLTRVYRGEYSVIFSRPGCKEHTEHVTVERGKKAAVSTQYTNGALEITSEPSGAWVEKDGIRLGTTPLTLRDLTPKQASFELTLPGYDPTPIVCDVQEGQTTKVQAELLRRDRVFTPKEVKTMPEPMESAQPQLSAAQRRMGGSVVLAATVRRDGSVSDVTVVSASDDDIARRCKAAVEQWRYHPATATDDRDVAARIEIPFKFSPSGQ